MLNYKKNTESCPWSLVDIVVISSFIIVLITMDPLGLGSNLVRSIKSNFFIFTKEPKLLYYFSTSVYSAIIKAVGISLIILAVFLRRVPFWKTVVFSGSNRIRKSYVPKFIMFILASALIRLMSITNPLIPNIPFRSVFPEAMLIGNITLIFATILVAPFIEEVLFRGFLYPAINKYTGMYPSIVITSLLFTFAHYPQLKYDPVFVIVIMSLSLIITTVRAKTGSTWLAILMHFMYNSTYVAIGLLYYFFYIY